MLKYTQNPQGPAAASSGRLPGQAPPSRNSPLGRAALTAPRGANLGFCHHSFIASPLCFIAEDHSPFQVLHYSQLTAASTDTSAVTQKGRVTFHPVGPVCGLTLRLWKPRVVVLSSNYRGLQCHHRWKEKNKTNKTEQK